MKFILLPILLFSNISLFAQIITVLDQSTKEPLEFVTIHSTNPRRITTTDNYGKANLTNFKDLNKIRFQLLGYSSVEISYSDILNGDGNIYMTESSISLDQVVISATKWGESSNKVPSKVSTITPREVELQNPQTAADLLNISGEVFIQKSQQGGGSPMIRGFATNRVLISVDGIRMNNAIFRSGNIQNVISLDPFSIENAEIVFGPGSIIYGSDAIGGSMNFYTLRPQFSLSEKTKINGHAQYRFSSANSENTGHFDVNIGLKNFASMTSISYNSFGNLTMGSSGPKEYLQNEYVKSQNGIDYIAANQNNKEQIPTEYSQFNLLQKFRYTPNDKWYLDYGFHYSATSNYSRYDRLTLYSDNLPKSSEWYYGPQIWMLNSLTATNLSENIYYDDLAIRLGYQYFQESRNDRNFRSSSLRKRKEEVYAYSINLDFNKSLSNISQIIYGLEGVLNDVKSEGKINNIDNDITSYTSSRYPNSEWYSVAAYLLFQHNLSDKLFLQTGLRYNYFGLNSKFDTTYFPFPFTKSELSSGALTGSIGATYNPNDKWSVGINLSSGFRSPNVDDIGKVFDSEPGSVIVPNPNLNAEYAYNAEINIAKIFSNNLKINISAFYTYLSNAMVRKDFLFNGLDSIIYDGTLSKVLAVQNSAKAYVWGIQSGFEYNFTNNLNISSKINYQKGEEESNNNFSPLRHVAPLYSISQLKYKYSRLTVNISYIYNGEISHSNLAEEEKNKINIYALDNNGMVYSPSWYALNFKLHYSITNSLISTFGVENITDQRYRPYSSGIAAPGRNFVLSIKLKY